MTDGSVWPEEHLRNPHELPRDNANHLVVFLLCPFAPKSRFDELHGFLGMICADLGKQMGAMIECVRADSFSTPSVIYQDIWTYIKGADAIIADVSGYNGNVMLELGVAAACRPKGQVIIIRDAEYDDDYLFDIKPARHLTYQRRVSGDAEFARHIHRALVHALAPVPFRASVSGSLADAGPVDLTLSGAGDRLLAPSNAHRRQIDDGVEFGSFYLFRYSWLLAGLQEHGAVSVKSKIRFTELRPGAQLREGWLGIMLRSHHFFAENGHLVYVTSDGQVLHTCPVDELGKSEDDPLLGQIDDFALESWVLFDLTFDDMGLRGSVGGVDFRIPVASMPFVYNAGKVRLQTHKARACVNWIEVSTA